MKSNNVCRVVLGMMLWLFVSSATTVWATDAICTIGEAPFTGHSEPIFEDRLKENGPYGLGPGWSVGGMVNATYTQIATPTGREGAFALEINYSSDWGRLVLERNRTLNPAGKRALVFRVRGIQNTSLYGQLWVTLREPITNDWISLVPVTAHMVSTANGTYNQSEWYTVVIPMEVLNPNDLFFNGIIIQTGNLETVYLDEIWLVQGLEFPLAGESAYTASMSSVFDHTMTDGSGNIAKWPAVDHVVTAYTGEVGDVSSHYSDATCIAGADAPYNDIMTNYTGAGECGDELFLSYDNHPAIDYSATSLTPIRAPGSGVVTDSDCAELSTSTSCAGRGTGWGKLIIDLVGPYTVSFNHLSFVANGIEVGSNVNAGDIVGYVGNTAPPEYSFSPHLHIGVLLDIGTDMYVDPYGWTATQTSDPYRVKAVSIPLWK